MPRRVVVDTDPGIDDALAILLALRSPEVNVVGLTVVAGNVVVDQGTQNALAVLGAAGVPQIPVYRGASHPLQGRLTTATHFHGSDGLGDLGLHGTAQPRPEAALDFLLHAAEDGAGPLTVLALGPLTNLALACRADPTWAGRLDRLVIMGGAMGVPGNVTPVAEANFYSDPEAAAIVMASGTPITLVGLDVTGQAEVPLRRFAAARTWARVSNGADPIAGLAVALLDYYIGVVPDPGWAGPALHDPLAVAVACQPDLVETKRVKVEVETAGDVTRGQSVAWLSGRREQLVDCGDHDDVIGYEPVAGNVDVALTLEQERFFDLFFRRLGLEQS